jgi:hypothetical protein
MINFYSNNFLNGDHEQAKNIIERSNRVTARKIDITYISLLGGIIITLFYVTTFEILLSPSHNNTED